LKAPSFLSVRQKRNNRILVNVLSIPARYIPAYA